LRRLRRELNFTTPISDIIFEIIAELITPIHSLRAIFGANKMVWRRQEFSLKSDGITIDGWNPIKDQSKREVK
jgi:hypothetical protein